MSDTFLTVVTNFRRRWRRLSLQLGFENLFFGYVSVLVGEVCVLYLLKLFIGSMDRCVLRNLFSKKGWWEELRFLFRDTTLLAMLGDDLPFLYHPPSQGAESAHDKDNFRVVMAHHTRRLEENISQWLEGIIISIIQGVNPVSLFTA